MSSVWRRRFVIGEGFLPPFESSSLSCSFNVKWKESNEKGRKVWDDRRTAWVKKGQKQEATLSLGLERDEGEDPLTKKKDKELVPHL